MAPEIRRLEADEARGLVTDLARVLVDCVEGGASVNFMHPFTQSDGEAFFRKVTDSVNACERILIAGFLNGELVGTVQLVTALPPNQRHRADVAKLLVARKARRRGVARMLMQAAEDAALDAGKTLLVLDTVTGGDAERLYASMGWVQAGIIPRYALFPDGRWADTTIFWKSIGQSLLSS